MKRNINLESFESLQAMGVNIKIYSLYKQVERDYNELKSKVPHNVVVDNEVSDLSEIKPGELSI